MAYGSVIDNTSGDAIFVTPNGDSGTPPPGNNPPAFSIDQPSADVAIAPGATVFFSGSATDPDGDDVTVLWDFGDGMTSTEFEPGDHTYSSQGTYTVTLTATDSHGLADPTPATRTITVNAAPTATLNQIQNEIFTPSCASCHGGGSPTAGLDLDPGQAHSNLVNVPATTESGTRVIPSNPDNSVLVTFLEDGHRSRPQSEIQLIRDWITSGAPNN